VAVKEGDEVKAGAVLLQVDDAVAKIQVKQAEAGVAAAQAKVRQAKQAVAQRQAEQQVQQAALDAAKQKLIEPRRRLSEARKTPANVPTVRMQELEDAVRNLELDLQVEERKQILIPVAIAAAEEEVAQATAAVNGQLEQLSLAQRAVAECQLKAPFDGKVIRLRAHPGELAGPALPEALIEFCPNAPYIVRAEVFQEFAGRVREGMSCKVLDEGGAKSQEWRGQVTRLSDWFAPRRSVLQEPLQINDVRTLECIIRLEPNGTRPRLNQRVRVFLGVNP
jgi:multidrug resistance efflux pump